MIDDNGYSGEYAPVFFDKLHTYSVLVKIKTIAYEPFKLGHWDLVKSVTIAQNFFCLEYSGLLNFRYFFVAIC